MSRKNPVKNLENEFSPAKSKNGVQFAFSRPHHADPLPFSHFLSKFTGLFVVSKLFFVILLAFLHNLCYNLKVLSSFRRNACANPSKGGALHSALYALEKHEDATF